MWWLFWPDRKECPCVDTTIILTKFGSCSFFVVLVVMRQTLYVDEGMRITRDMDDNFFVFTRA